MHILRRPGKFADKEQGSGGLKDYKERVHQMLLVSLVVCKTLGFLYVRFWRSKLVL